MNPPNPPLLPPPTSATLGRSVVTATGAPALYPTVDWILNGWLHAGAPVEVSISLASLLSALAVWVIRSPIIPVNGASK